MHQEEIDRHIALLRAEVVPALGCTEPIAVALAVARARELLGQPVTRVEVQASANIYKNGMGVGIPGTGRTGLPTAAALGAVQGESSDQLELLKHVDDQAVQRALSLVQEGRVEIQVANVPDVLYVHATVWGEREAQATCTIRGTHTGICAQSRNGRPIPLATDTNQGDEEGTAPSPRPTGRDITVASIFEFATTTPFAQLEFILESARLNERISNEGLHGEWGLQVGRQLWHRVESGTLGNDLMTRAMAMTAAASDARMAGSTTPVMSNSGSGNQGITATLPVLAVAQHLKSSQEELARALALSHLVAIHIKGYLGRLSALCGCVVAASGAGCGIALLMGGGLTQIESTIKNMLGNISGMLCDGAKVGCALKVASGVGSAVMSALLAMDGSCISEKDGIIDRSVEQTIQNLGQIGATAMRQTDQMVLDIMTKKANSARSPENC